MSLSQVPLRLETVPVVQRTLEDIAREGARRTLQKAIEDEVADALDTWASIYHKRVAQEFARITAPNGVIIATADNKLAAIDYYIAKDDLDALEEFIRSSKTNWLTPDVREQFELATFTPQSLARLFEGVGFEVIEIIGKSIIPIRQNRKLLEADRAIKRLLKLEQQLAKDPAAAARAGHLQITARRVASV